MELLLGIAKVLNTPTPPGYSLEPCFRQAVSWVTRRVCGVRVFGAGKTRDLVRV